MITLDRKEKFADRHIGPDSSEISDMLRTLGFDDMDSFIDAVVPEAIRTQHKLTLDPALDEAEALDAIRAIVSENKIYRSLIGMGYSDTVTPAPILRNILENPGWYTQYTPYQAEISQGRLEALLNFQTMIIDLTGLEVANASLLDEGTAAAEAMAMFFNIKKHPENAVFLVSDACHPQTLAVVQTRAEPLGIEVRVASHSEFTFDENTIGALLQYPTTDGAVEDYTGVCEQAHAAGAYVAVAADLLSLALLTPPGEFGADVAVGNSQRFGVPLGFGGPHAAYFATHEQFKRLIPGRIIGVSRDSRGKPALRMALQTREQHIRREKATSNICTAQVLLAIMAGMYAVWHGPDGIRAIATRVHNLTKVLAAGLKKLGFELVHDDFFDTLRVRTGEYSARDLLVAAEAQQINLRRYEDGSVGIALDELSTAEEVTLLLEIFAMDRELTFTVTDLAAGLQEGYQGRMKRSSEYLTHPVFNSHHSETNMLRYMRSLEERDLSLAFSMIPLGSCTMKLNATTEMIPLSWPELAKIHPFAPENQSRGYRALFAGLEKWLAEITGFDAISLQPNAGAQGEYTGLLTIRAYHRDRGDAHRNVCLIPSSAHGTNPASAVMAGMKVVIVKCDERGNIDVEDVRSKAQEHSENLAAFMVTYPSTHGVFEAAIREICDIIHEHGGQVYMDGANLNAQVGLCRPAELGADVLHMNLHKTFAIPHGGGGPGMGPIGVKAHLADFLPGHPVVRVGGEKAIGPVSAAPWGSASILVISWLYIAMMGAKGLTRATQVAILNANYMAKRLKEHFPVLYTGTRGWVAHEFILDLRQFKASAGIEAEDLAKRLMDYGFHAPTMSFPVPGTFMVEPTESESKAELDRFCEAMIAMLGEIRDIEEGKADRQDNVLKNAPHTADMVISDDWGHAYSREKAAFPAEWTRERKFWTAVARIDNAWGDRHLVCACPPIEDYE